MEQSAIRLGLNLRTVMQSDSREFLNAYTHEPLELSFDIPMNVDGKLREGKIVVPLNSLDVPEGFCWTLKRAYTSSRGGSVP